VNKSEQINELASALAKAQGVFESAEMDSVNPHFKSKYASLGAIILAVKQGLSSNGLALSQMLIENEKGMALETTLLHSSGQWLSGSVPVILDKQNMQGLGSAITYAKRYAIAAILGVVADQDDDGEAAQGRLSENHEVKHVTSAQPLKAAAKVPAQDGQCPECGVNLLPSKFKQGEMYCPNKKNHQGAA
jgi:hypothetical protein